MSRTTDDAIDMQNAMAAMEEIYEAWERERALNWISRNPSEAIVAAVMASPRIETVN
jgi:predicted phosphoadenosine phosphosulfate sulfurtransferase